MAMPQQQLLPQMQQVLLNGASLRELALAVLATAAALLALIPILLERFGSDWLRQRPRTN